MILKSRFLLGPVMAAVVLSTGSAVAQHEKFSPAALEASVQKAAATAEAKAPVKSTAPQCSVPKEIAKLDRPLVHTGRLLAAGLPIRIVALGSSSTAGAGASSPEHSYPSRLAAELHERFPDHEITVLNRGANGEEVQEMLARFETTVVAERPDLVLWQVGTNTVLRDNPLPPASSTIEKGLARLKAIGADVILIDPQFAPKVIAKGTLSKMLDMLALKAKQYNVNLFQRFALMRNWREHQGLSFDAFVSPDRLHMNDWSYDCVAKVLSASIAEAALRPTASAAATAPRSVR